MVKKIVLTVVILGLAGGGFFYWWQGHADERALNKTLPEGIRVDKCLLSGEYRVINKIDGYEFKVPEEWKGVKEIGYIPEREEMGYTGTSLNLEGRESSGRLIGIDRFNSGGDMNTDLELWAKTQSDTFGLVGGFSKDEIGGFKIVKTQENVHFGGEYTYFFKQDRVIYSITGPSEEFIKEIILNGKW